MNSVSLSRLENREYGRGDPLRWPRDTLYPQKLALTSRTSGGRSVSIVCLQNKATEFVLFLFLFLVWHNTGNAPVFTIIFFMPDLSLNPLKLVNGSHLQAFGMNHMTQGQSYPFLLLPTNYELCSRKEINFCDMNFLNNCIYFCIKYMFSFSNICIWKHVIGIYFVFLKFICQFW
jgi:hypothetical protein